VLQLCVAQDAAADYLLGATRLRSVCRMLDQQFAR
jgi:hypothetical protein